MRFTSWLPQVMGRVSGLGWRGGSVRRPATALIRRSARTTGRLATTTAVIESLEPRELLAISVLIDYSLDTNNFFNTQAKKDLLQAADAIGSRLTDNLLAITPGSGNTWTAIFDHPGTGDEARVNNRAIAANTVLVFAGGRNLLPNQAGVGGFGGFDAEGSNTFLDGVEARGQSGALLGSPTDFGPWGGAISFDAETIWHFGLTTSGLDNNELDFLSVAQHEMAHLFGFGTADSWNRLVSGGTFTGAASKALNGNANVPLFGDLSHWADGVTSYGSPKLAARRLRHEICAVFPSGFGPSTWQEAEHDCGGASFGGGVAGVVSTGAGGSAGQADLDRVAGSIGTDGTTDRSADRRVASCGPELGAAVQRRRTGRIGVAGGTRSRADFVGGRAATHGGACGSRATRGRRVFAAWRRFSEVPGNAIRQVVVADDGLSTVA